MGKRGAVTLSSLNFKLVMLLHLHDGHEDKNKDSSLMMMIMRMNLMTHH